MKGETNSVEEQLAMFERMAKWLLYETEVWRRSREAPWRPPSRRRLEELRTRTRQMLREYLAWLEREGVREAVDRILEERRERFGKLPRKRGVPGGGI